MLDDGQRQGSFDCFVNASIDVSERISVFDDFLFHGAVVDSPENAGVERYGIGDNAAVAMPGFIRFHHVGVKAVEHYIFVFSEFLETVEGGFIGLGSPDFSVLFQFDDDVLHEVEQGVFVFVAVEFVDNVVGSVGQFVCGQFAVYSCQSFYIPVDVFLD